MSQNTPELKKDDGGYLVFGIAIALGLLLMKDTIPLLLLLVGGVGAWRLWKRYHKKHQDKLSHLNQVFYHLIQENEGWITPLDLAMNAQVPAQDVQEFLDQKVTEFSAQFEVTEQGGILYYFSTAQAWLESSVNGEIETLQTQAEDLTTNASPPLENFQEDRKLELENQKEVSLFPVPPSVQSNIPNNLNQLELAKRLKVHPSTLSKWKTKPQFQDWSFKKDPDHMTWQYSVQTKRFYPVFKSKNKSNTQSQANKFLSKNPVKKSYKNRQSS